MPGVERSREAGEPANWRAGERELDDPILRFSGSPARQFHLRLFSLLVSLAGSRMGAPRTIREILIAAHKRRRLRLPHCELAGHSAEPGMTRMVP